MTSPDFLNRRQPSFGEAGQLVALKDAPKALENISLAVQTALAQPLDFPPFEAALVQDDRVALAVDSTIPALSEVLLGAVEYLLQHEVELQNISVVLSNCSDETLQSVRDNLPPHLHQKLAIFVHNPAEQNELGYLAASSEDALPIYVNRRLLDADVVLPITLYHNDQSLDYFGVAGIFPLFADAEVMKRCSTLSNLGSPVQCQKRCRDADEAAWLLGTQCVVKVVPAGNGRVLKIFSGLPAAIEAAVEKEVGNALQLTLDEFADIVVAEIDGDANEQVWPNVARALYAARAAIRNNGTIVLRTKIQIAPGASLRRLTSLDSPEKIEKQLSKESGNDTLTASLLSDYLQRFRIFMQSKLAQDAVEDLGVGYVTDDHQIEKLVASNKKCLWLPTAQHYAVQCQASESIRK